MRIGNYAALAAAALLSVSGCGDDKTDPVLTDTATEDTTTDDTMADDAAPADVEEIAGEDVTAEDTAPTDVAVEVITPPPVCEVAPIPVLGAQHTSNTDLCLACVNDACCSEMTACADNAGCLAARTCFTTCDVDDAACFTACGDANEGYLAFNSPYITCRTENCGYQCALDACVGNIVFAEPTVESYTIVNTFNDFQNGTPVPDLTVKVCAKTDTDCASPLSQGTTDAEGKITLELASAPSGLDVYLDVTGAGYRPTDFWYLSADAEARLSLGTLTWQVLSDATTGILTGFVGATLDEARGSVTFGAISCDQRALPGIAVSADTEDEFTVHLYMIGPLPSVAVNVTQAAGQGGLLNLPVGPTVLTATGIDGRVWGTNTVNVRAGRMIGTNMSPTPLPEVEQR